MRDAAELAASGTPVVAVITERFWSQSALVTRSVGLPDLPRVSIPYPVAGTGADNVRRVAVDAAPSILEALRRGRSVGPAYATETAPTTPRGPVLLTADDEDDARQQLLELGCTDGLPVVVPTPERVQAMLAAAPHLDVDDVLGVVPPQQGIATVRSVAVDAVLAGVPPPHLPLLCAAVRAVCDPAFTLDVVQGTTHNAAVLLVVNGPARDVEPRVERGSGALGPGFVANATIGRALRLVLLNAGGAKPGAGDMATLGQPAKFTCCVAEAEEDSPFPPLADERGFAPGTAAVTAMAVEGPRQIMFVPVGDDPDADAARLVELLAGTVLTPGTLGAMGYAGSAAIVLSPLHAQVLAAAGHDRASLQRAVFAAAQLPRREIERLHGFVRTPGGLAPDDDRSAIAGVAVPQDVIPVLSSPDDVVIAVAGGAGTYSAVLVGLAHRTGGPVTVAFDPHERQP